MWRLRSGDCVGISACCCPLSHCLPGHRRLSHLRHVCLLRHHLLLLLRLLAGVHLLLLLLLLGLGLRGLLGVCTPPLEQIKQVMYHCVVTTINQEDGDLSGQLYCLLCQTSKSYQNLRIKAPYHGFIILINQSFKML